MATPPLSLLLLLVVLGPMMPCPSLSSSTPQCRLDFTALALLSCQEAAPQSPTRSCCSALLYAVDTWPPNVVDKGVCCLCMYVVARRPAFDLAGAYVACGGKDAAAVQAWNEAVPDCNDPCGLDGPPTPPRSPPRRPSGGGGSRAKLGPGAIVAIVFAGAAILLGLGWCIYRTFFSAAAKARRSPDPSNRSSPAPDDHRHQGGAGIGGGGLEMSRLSSARRSTSVLLDQL